MEKQRQEPVRIQLRTVWFHSLPCAFPKVSMAKEVTRNLCLKQPSQITNAVFPLSGLSGSVCGDHLDPGWERKNMYQEHKNLKKRRKTKCSLPGVSSHRVMKVFMTCCDSEAQSYHSLAVNHSSDNWVRAILLVETKTLTYCMKTIKNLIFEWQGESPLPHLRSQ